MMIIYHVVWCCISCQRKGEKWCVMTIMLDDDDNVSCSMFYDVEYPVIRMVRNGCDDNNVG